MQMPQMLPLKGVEVCAMWRSQAAAFQI